GGGHGHLDGDHAGLDFFDCPDRGILTQIGLIIRCGRIAAEKAQREQGCAETRREAIHKIILSAAWRPPGDSGERWRSIAFRPRLAAGLAFSGYYVFRGEGSALHKSSTEKIDW